MTQPPSKLFNLAAVLGYSMRYVHANCDTANGAVQFSAYCRSPLRSSMDMTLSTTDPQLWKAVLALPSIGPRLANFGADPSDRGFSQFEVPYVEMLELIAAMYRLGVTFDSELANQQACAMAFSPSPAMVQAHAAFVQHATVFLTQVEQLSISGLDTRKGIRQLDRPCRGVALAHFNDYVTVSPDPLSERYVHIRVQVQVTRHNAIRELAFDHYERLGQRILLTLN